MAAQDPLEKYKQMRDFQITPEPKGSVAKASPQLTFVIQKHAATRLHYDFRLELDGTLKSWAVPKGPSLDPADKRMAVQTEDHPLSYGDFEGVIPAKQYGAGTVIVWDRGTWEPVGDPHAGYAAGKLKFRLHGEKLSGGWNLVRLRSKDERQEPWLLIKERDEIARPAAEYSVVDALPESVLSGRSVSEADGPRSLRAASSTTSKAAGTVSKKASRTTAEPVKSSAAKPDPAKSAPAKSAPAKSAPAKSAPAKSDAAKSSTAKSSTAKPARQEKSARATKAKRATEPGQAAAEEPEPARGPRQHLPPNKGDDSRHASDLAALTGAKRGPLPALIAPQLATLVERVPASGDWSYEIKYDGYRILARIDKSEVRLFTRNGNDWTAKLGRLAAAIQALELQPSWLDGEIVVIGERGIPNFGALQNAFDDASTERIQYYVFDIPYHAGLDLTGTPLSERRALLAALLAASPSPKVKFSASFDAGGEEVLAHACKLGLEGIVGKRADSGYISRRSPNWIKVKCSLRQEFVIVGYTDPQGSRTGIGALLLGVHDDKGNLRYAGKVGTGFDTRTLDDLKRALDPLTVDTTSLVDKPKDARGHWVKPGLVAEVSFGEWTHDGIIRHSVFQGLRTDKPASAITREKPAPVPTEARAATRSAAKAPMPPASPAVALHPSLAQARITHPERVIDPGSGLTKLDLVNYYAHAAPRILPHLLHRPVSLVRAPAGIDRQLFFQKHSDTLKIPALKELDPAIDPGHPPYIEVSNATALIGAAQMNVVEFHTWNATTRNIDKPDRMLFDLDPGEGLEWPLMQEAAGLVRTFLDELGLASFLKTSGGKGLHVVVPLTPKDDWDTVKDFSRGVVEHIARVVPSRFVAKSGPANRVGRIFIDYLRNGRGATTACAYSARARTGLGVSIPCAWDELPSLTSGAQWTIVNAHERLAAKADPWAAYAGTRQTLAAARKKLGIK